MTSGVYRCDSLMIRCWNELLSHGKVGTVCCQNLLGGSLGDEAEQGTRP